MAVGINFAKHRKVRSAQQARKIYPSSRLFLTCLFYTELTI